MLVLDHGYANGRWFMQICPITAMMSRPRRVKGIRIFDDLSPKERLDGAQSLHELSASDNYAAGGLQVVAVILMPPAARMCLQVSVI